MIDMFWSILSMLVKVQGKGKKLEDEKVEWGT